MLIIREELQLRNQTIGPHTCREPRSTWKGYPETQTRKEAETQMGRLELGKGFQAGLSLKGRGECVQKIRRKKMIPVSQIIECFRKIFEFGISN